MEGIRRGMTIFMSMGDADPRSWIDMVTEHRRVKPDGPMSSGGTSGQRHPETRGEL